MVSCDEDTILSMSVIVADEAVSKMLKGKYTQPLGTAHSRIPFFEDLTLLVLK